MIDVDPGVLKREFQQVPFDENINCYAKIFINKFKDFLTKKNTLQIKKIVIGLTNV